MLKYRLRQKYSIISSASSFYGCEVCGIKPTAAKKSLSSINEFHKDGTIKIHYTCSKHIVDLYDKIIKEIENNKSKIVK